MKALILIRQWNMQAVQITILVVTQHLCEGLTAETMTHDCKRRNQIIAEGNTSIGDGPKYKGHGIIRSLGKVLTKIPRL